MLRLRQAISGRVLLYSLLTYTGRWTQTWKVQSKHTLPPLCLRCWCSLTMEVGQSCWVTFWAARWRLLSAREGQRWGFLSELCCGVLTQSRPSLPSVRCICVAFSEVSQYILVTFANLRVCFLSYFLWYEPEVNPTLCPISVTCSPTMLLFSKLPEMYLKSVAGCWNFSKMKESWHKIIIFILIFWRTFVSPWIRQVMPKMFFLFVSWLWNLCRYFLYNSVRAL